MPRIIELQAENFKRIKAVDIRPKGATVVVGGRNAQGKTSVLDAVQAVLGGGRSLPGDPIRHGQRKAVIVADLDDIVVTRRFNKKGSSLEVVAKDGRKISSPQKVLDALTNSLSFDPLAFSRKHPKEQGDILRDLAGLDLTGLDSRIERAVELRRVKNSEARRCQAVLKATPSGPGDPPEARIELSEAAGRLASAMEHNQEVRAVKQRESALWNLVTKQGEELRRLQIELQELKGEIVKKGPMLDEGTLRDELDGAEENNRRFSEHEKHVLAYDDSRQAERAATDAEEAVLVLRAEKEERIKSADYPVEGLSVDDEGVVLNGVALSQASGAELIRVSAAIGLALNPEMRVLLIRDGSLLDDDSMRALTTLAEENDAQIWIERVGSGSEVGVLIEDGEVMREEE